MKKLFLALFLIPALLSAKDIRIMAGFKTTNILWNNPGKELMGPQVEEGEDFVRGGSFDVAQPGLELRADVKIDDKMRIPFSIDINFFSAKELIPINEFIIGRLMHEMNFIGFSTGLHYDIKKFRLLDTRIYGGLEVRTSILNNIKYKNFIIFKELPELNEYNNLPTKETAVRLGPVAKLGVDAKFNQYMNFNISFAYSIVNLIGRDDSRGELFTVEKQFENGESLVHTFQLSLMLQYNIK